ncbi:MAG: FecR domain-containing protein [Candidatus Omnitrophica bacterium]|nr:FecR domain-containing protein [Candidatus Omnitrophota bacterium]
MRKQMKYASARLVLGFSFIVLLVVFADIRMVKGENAPTVEGEWEAISANVPTLQKSIGKRLTIAREGDSYELKWLDGSGYTYSGNDTRIVYTTLEDLGHLLEDGASTPLAYSVKQAVAGQKVPFDIVYTVSGDGSFLQESVDGIVYTWNKETGQLAHYKIIPGKYTLTFKRISGPALNKAQVSEPVSDNKTDTSAFAQVESRGEFYFLTKNGRKVSGEETSKVPLEEGTKVVTGKDGHVRMTLPDNTTFTVGPNSDLVIDKFVYDSDKSPEKIMVTMTIGVFRWVTGKTAQHDPTQMKVNLPVMAVGIRGTDFEATVTPDGSGSVVLYFGQLEITEKKTGFTFVLDAGQKVTFGADGSISRPMKIQ